MTQNKASSPDPATLQSTEPCTQKETVEKKETKSATADEVKKGDTEPEVDCPINFEKLSMGALRKYQYRFRINMAEHEKDPLITRD